MRATGTLRTPQPSAAGRLSGEVRRAVLACGITLGFCLSAVLIASWTHASMNAESRANSAREADLSTGSVLVISPDGKRCRQRTIDNSSWQIRDNGWVDCDEALAKSANAGADLRTPGSRLDLIREGFRGRP
jgi:hypothetical protein